MATNIVPTFGVPPTSTLLSTTSLTTSSMSAAVTSLPPYVLVSYNVQFTYSEPTPNAVTKVTTTTVQDVNRLQSTVVVLSASDSFAVPPIYTTTATIPALVGAEWHFESVSQAMTNFLAVAPTATSSTGDGTNTPAASSTVSTTPSSSSNDYSAGATAGIAIASAIAGALVAGFIVWLLFRRRALPRGSRGGFPNRISRHDAAEMAVFSPTATDKLLSAPMEEEKIAQQVSRLGTTIRNHAHSFFATTFEGLPAAGTAGMSDIHALLGAASPASEHLLGALLASPKTRIAGVRFLLAWCILKSAQYSDGDHALLPPGLSGCVALTKSGSDQLELAARWRHITGMLLKPGESVAQQQEIDLLATRLDNILKAFASPEKNRERQQNLRQLVKLGAALGMTLLTQPTTWMFDWEGQSGSRRSDLVVFPALLQTGDDKGRALQRPRMYSDREVEQIEASV